MRYGELLRESSFGLGWLVLLPDRSPDTPFPHLPPQIEKHWTDKELKDMSERDWRIFREDFNISFRGNTDILPIRNWDEGGIPKEIREVWGSVGKCGVWGRQHRHPHPAHPQLGRGRHSQGDQRCVWKCGEVWGVFGGRHSCFTCPFCRGTLAGFCAARRWAHPSSHGPAPPPVGLPCFSQ